MRYLDSLRSLGMTIIAAAGILLLAGCCDCVYTVEVSNPLDADRHPEMVEVCYNQVADRLGIREGDSFIVKNRKGQEIPHQVTSDGKVIFQVQMKANGKETFRITKGQPA